MGVVREIRTPLGGCHGFVRPSPIGQATTALPAPPGILVARPRVPVFIGDLQRGQRFLLFRSHGLRRVWRVGIFPAGQRAFTLAVGVLALCEISVVLVPPQPLHHGRHHRCRHGLCRVDDTQPLVAERIRGTAYTPCRGFLTGEHDSIRWESPSF
jgi:hypothetical protein